MALAYALRKTFEVDKSCGEATLQEPRGCRSPSLPISQPESNPNEQCSKEPKMVCSKGRAATAVLLACLGLGLSACADGAAYPYEGGYYYDEGFLFDRGDFDRRDDFRFHHHLHHNHGRFDHGDLVPRGIHHFGRPSGSFGHGGGFGGDFGGGRR
jgi:hypothetical protein